MNPVRFTLLGLAAVATLAVSGCGGGGGGGGDDDLSVDQILAESSISNEALIIYADLTVITRGNPGPRLRAANEQLYPATLAFVDAIRENRDDVGAASLDGLTR